jgi:hypothetical protein
MIFALVATLAAVQPVAAQHRTTNGQMAAEKNHWFDFQVAQHVALNKWSATDYGNAGLPGGAMTEFRGAFNVTLFKSPVSLFVDMGVGVMPASPMREFDLGRMPKPTNGTQYYLREVKSQRGIEGASSHFKIGTGLAGNIRATDRLTVMPALGVGTLYGSRRGYEVELKEQGTNMQYTATYSWARDEEREYEYDNSESLGYLSGRLNFRYSLNGRTNLIFGLEYTHMFDTMNFYAHYRNVFNGNVQRKTMVAGQRMNMIGLSIGLSFK